MRIITVFLLVTTRLFGQSHQADIIKFVDDNLGKKIGTGLCYELVQGAVQSYLPSYKMGYKDFDKKFYGKQIKVSKVQPGDILFLSGIIDHVCIVYKVDGSGRIWVAEQNAEEKQKDSVVKISRVYLDSDEREEDYGKVKYKFYRPK